MKAFRWLLAVALVLAGAAAVFLWRPGRHADQTRAASSPPAAGTEAQAAPLPPPARLHLRVMTSDAGEDALLAPGSEAWGKAEPTAIILNRTPRVYQTEPATPRPAPALEARAVRAGGKLFVRLRWEDATRNAPEAPPRWAGEAGVPEVIYKRPTGETAAFADAAAVMVPERWTGPAFPSLVMGDAKNPVRLFYWNASRGADELSATGRATPQPSGRPFVHRAEHADGHWALTAALPDQADGTPVAFAVWDGARHDRDGFKFFSVWYVLTGK
jgi:dimethylsulfide dehydrogenase subunit gamma/complex iron-sulfur molybdoenzyme family reductase subunit gamma